MNPIEPLAIDGGPQSVTNKISNWPRATASIRASVDKALETGLWGQYESELSQMLCVALEGKFGCSHSLLTCSGTMAVELALRGVGVKQGDEVVLSAYDFPGNFRAVEAIGAKPTIVDVEENGWLIDERQVSDAISESTSAVLLSHLHGQLVDVSKIRSLVPNGIPIVEDCCQVPGASVKSKPCGSLGDVSAFSFGGSKLLSAGRGGAVLSNDESIIGKAKNFGSRGNEAFPLSQLQAAALLPQVDELNEKNRIRQQSVESLVAAVKRVSRNALVGPEVRQSAWYKVPWLLAEEFERELVIARLKAEGVPADIGFRGFAKRTARRCRKVGDLRNAKRAAAQTILMHHPALLEPRETIDQISDGFEKVIGSLDG